MWDSRQAGKSCPDAEPSMGWLEVIGEADADAVVGWGVVGGWRFGVAQVVSGDADLETEDEGEICSAAERVAGCVVTDAGFEGDDIAGKVSGACEAVGEGAESGSVEGDARSEHVEGDVLRAGSGIGSIVGDVAFDADEGNGADVRGELPSVHGGGVGAVEIGSDAAVAEVSICLDGFCLGVGHEG